MTAYTRPIYTLIHDRLSEKRRFLQILLGPRQVGKTTLVRKLLTQISAPTHYASADEPGLRDKIWLEQQWDIARTRLKNAATTNAILIIDEIQKIPNWSAIVKKLWDEDSFNGITLKVILLGSSSLLIQHGLTESLAGRFEIIPITHWSFTEMQAAFDWTLDQYIYFGGYPGAADLINDESRWRHYINDSLIETTISRDILLASRVDKPALLRQLFYLGCAYSSQIISYQKILGQLHDAGNTTTLAHYLQLLTNAGLLTGITKFSDSMVKKRASSPKLQVLNTGLISALGHETFHSAQQNREYWGRVTESAVAAYLLNEAIKNNWQLYYWRDRNFEVDFILQAKKDIIAFEVKSGSKRTSLPGLAKFSQQYPVKRQLLLGGQGIPLIDFFSQPVANWI